MDDRTDGAHFPARLLLVRHGETLWNRERRMQGQLDSPLSPLGRAQAEAVAKRLRFLRPAALYASDLGRAAETARAVGAACGLEPSFDAGLREQHLGVFQGLTRDEARERHAEAWAAYRSPDPDAAAHGGESWRQAHERALAALRRCAERHPGERIVVVGHGGTLDAAFRACMGLPLERPRRFALLNASLNVLDYSDAAWRLVTWGDVAHLATEERSAVR